MSESDPGRRKSDAAFEKDFEAVYIQPTRDNIQSLIWDQLDGRCKDIFIGYFGDGLMDLAALE